MNSKHLFLVPQRLKPDWAYPERIQFKRRKARANGHRDITVVEKDYRFRSPKPMPYTYELLKLHTSEEQFRKNAHYLCDLEEEPGTPVDALRQEGATGSRLPSLFKVKQLNRKFLQYRSQ